MQNALPNYAKDSVKSKTVLNIQFFVTLDILTEKKNGSSPTSSGSHGEVRGQGEYLTMSSTELIYTALPKIYSRSCYG